MNLLTIIVNNPLWKLLATHQNTSNTSKSPLAPTATSKQPPKKTWRFTFYGETGNELKDSLKNLNQNLNYENSSESLSLERFQQKLNQDADQDLACFPLARAHRNDRLRIVQINGSPATQRYLMDMGLCPGKEIQVVSLTDKGSALVTLGDRSFGLGASQAQQIMVTKEPGNCSATQLPKKSNSTQDKSSDFHNQKPSPLKSICLGDLTQGCKGRVLGYQPVNRGYKGKLLAMGLTPGTEFAITRYAPLGDPVEIRVRGFSLSLRQAEAAALLVEEVCE